MDELPGGRRARRRAAFLDAADQAIRQAGPGVTMADVAAAAGVTKPVLYRYVSDKSDLAGALAERYAERLLELLEEGTSPADDPRDTLARTINAYLTFIESEPAMYEFLVQRGPIESPDVAERLTRFNHQLAVRITEVIERDLRRFGRSTDGAAVFAHGLIGMVQSAGEWWLTRTATDQDALTREALATHLVDILWAGLSGVPRAEPG